MRVRIKICGLTSEEAIDAAVACGVDAAGFVFAPSPRRVTAERAADLARKLPSFVLKVAVFAEPTAAEVERVVALMDPDRIQIEAGSIGALGATMRRRAIPVFHDSPDEREWGGGRWSEVPAILLDGRRSGHGEACDWSLAAQLAQSTRLVLAGGLSPENVARAIRIVRPFAVDVSSGVESSPGVKDPGRIAAFVAAVRVAEVER